jgi:hypothetical protein
MFLIIRLTQTILYIYGSLLCCVLVATWSGCWDNDPSSNLGRHAPPLHRVCQFSLLILMI